MLHMSGLQLGLGLLEKSVLFQTPDTERGTQETPVEPAQSGHPQSQQILSEPCRNKTLVFPLPLKTGWTR